MPFEICGLTRLEKLTPNLLVCGMCGIDDEAIANFFGDDLVDDFEDDATERRRNLVPGDSNDCPKKRSRQKALIAIIAMGMMVFARSSL